MSTKDDPGAVDAYLAKLPDADRNALERVRSVVLRLVPEPRQRIGYGIPVVASDGDVVGFAAQAKHLSFYTMSPPLVAELKDDLERFEVSGATIHFTAERPLPVKLIEKIVRARLRQNKERKAKR